MVPTGRTRRWCALAGRSGQAAAVAAAATAARALPPPLLPLPPCSLPAYCPNPSAGGPLRLCVGGGLCASGAAGGLPGRRGGVGVARHNSHGVGPAERHACAAPGGPPVPGGQCGMRAAVHGEASATGRICCDCMAMPGAAPQQACPTDCGCGQESTASAAAAVRPCCMRPMHKSAAAAPSCT